MVAGVPALMLRGGAFASTGSAMVSRKSSWVGHGRLMILDGFDLFSYLFVPCPMLCFDFSIHSNMLHVAITDGRFIVSKTSLGYPRNQTPHTPFLKKARK